ncbi:MULTISPECIES: hypothetical protein [unclassified Mesorhizobium]|uniref:hypothetical protein n=1 Tax=unclassified Mesorhizobium TaxID=325217 RepID=UPI002417DCEA|nr:MULTISPECIES: hypothetical protein [unclassified Mesorhizobium]WFP60422.1 hypothetical protein QAZ47_18050 [Mesorhizobium sp. WSM4904]WFP73646.1 hypothetical protein QAZ22_17935 [Mesorhizobium sp. WSM4906]
MAYFAFACSIAMACAGPAAGGPRGGGHDAGDHQGDGGNHDEGGNGGPHKGPAGDPVGDISDPLSNDPPPNDDGISTTTTAAAPSTPAATADPPAGGGHSLDLPLALQPAEGGIVPPAVHPIEVLPGVPDSVVRACHDAVVQAAASFGAISVGVSSAGSIHRLSRTKMSAPIQVSIDYVRDGNVETRQAAIGCELNAKGNVIGLT